MIKNILVGYGGTRGSLVALAQALDLAQAAGARLRLARIETVGDDSGIAALAMDSPAEVGLSASGVLAAAAERAEVEPDSMGPSAVLEEGALRCRDAGVNCSLARFYGDPAERLSELSRLADVVVIGRRGDASAYRGGLMGRTARKLAAGALVPTLFADREYLEPRSATLYYEPRPEGGRALAVAAEVASLLNITLNVACAGRGRTSPAQAEQEARFALRAYHLDGDFIASSQAGAEAVQNAALLWGDPLLVVPTSPPRGLFPDFSVLRAAMATPNTNVLLVP